MSNRKGVSVIVPELPSLLRHITPQRILEVIDAAEAGDTRDLFALYRDMIASDTQIQSDFVKRKAAVLGDAMNLTPFDKKLDADNKTKELCWGLLEKSFFTKAVSHLLDATLFPVSVLEKIYGPGDASPFDVVTLIPVPYQLLDLSKGTVKIFDTDDQGRVLNTSHDADPARYIIHRGHVMPTPDTWGGPARSLLFWWLLRSMNRNWWSQFLERYGQPFLKGKYASKDDRQVLERAFRLAQKLGGIVISSKTEAEIVQAANISGDHYKSFIECCNLEISKLIVGQTLSSTPAATGLGSGVAYLQGQVRGDLRRMDIQLLSNTLRGQLFAPFCAINNYSGAAPLLLFGTQTAEQSLALIATVKELAAAGYEPDDDGEQRLAEVIGFGIRRRGAPGGFSFGLSAPSPRRIPSPPDHIADQHAAALAAAFTVQLQPIASAIRESTSPEDCLRRVGALAARLDPTHAGEIIAQAFSAYAAAGHNSAML
jgi:phage gp29-like protein